MVALRSSTSGIKVISKKGPTMPEKKKKHKKAWDTHTKKIKKVFAKGVLRYCQSLFNHTSFLYLSRFHESNIKHLGMYIVVVGK